MVNSDEKYPEGHFVGMWIGIGIANFSGIGVPLCVATGNVAFLGIGPAMGVGFGAGVDAVTEIGPPGTPNAAWSLGRIKNSDALPRVRALQADATLDEEFLQEVEKAINTMMRLGLRPLHSVRRKWLVSRMASTP